MEDITSYIKSHSNGRSQPICGAKIAATFGLSGAEVRRLISAARRAGNPICSTGRGYYIASSKDELKDTINSLTGRISAMIGARDGLIRSLRDM